MVANATIPVIETGTGNCHIYVDETADLDMAVNIINNAKTQRIGVCNACESLVLHESIVDELMPRLSAKLSESHVEIRGDERVQKAAKDAVAATEKTGAPNTWIILFLQRQFQILMKPLHISINIIPDIRKQSLPIIMSMRRSS